MAGPEDEDPPQDDPFFSGDRGETIDAFNVDQNQDWLFEHGYGEGDMLPIRWEDENGTHETEIQLPGNFSDESEWSDFFDDLRDTYEDWWDSDDGDSPDGGSATAG